MRTAPHRARPAGTVAGGEARHPRPPAGWDPRLLSADRRTGGPPPGGARRVAVRAGRDARDPPADVARGGAVRPARPPDGGPYRVPHRRPAAGDRALNLLDLLIILTAGAAAYGGYRLGFLARIFSWAGLAMGALVADRFLPDVVGFFSSSDPQIRLIAAISFLVGASMLGQGIGLAIGSLLHAAFPLGAGLGQGDRDAGL